MNREDMMKELAASMDRHVQAMRDHERDSQHRKIRQATSSAMQQVCFSMAGNAMVSAIFIKDQKAAAESFGESIRWQVAGTLAAMGSPEIVSDYLRQTKTPA